jgi:hypothetical protein
MHNSGSLPTPYSACPYASTILASHCCSGGVCDGGWLDVEFDRYRYCDWDGLGDPKPAVNGTEKSGKARWRRRSLCMGMELVWALEKTHWPPLGLDGLPVKDFSFVEWGRPNRGDAVYAGRPRKGVKGERGKGGRGEKGKRGLGWNKGVENRALIWKEMTGQLRGEYVEHGMTNRNDGFVMWHLLILLCIGALFIVLQVSHLISQHHFGLPLGTKLLLSAQS